VIQRTFVWIDPTNVPGTLDWIAFLLGGAGIAFTAIQLVRSRGSLAAAEDALKKARASLLANQAIFVLPAFQEISDSIDAAIRADNRDELQTGLSRFSARAHEAISVLRALENVIYNPFVTEIEGVIPEVGDARDRLFSDANSDCLAIGATVASHIRALSPRLSGLAVGIRNEPGQG
jgi:hypothetical protein